MTMVAPVDLLRSSSNESFHSTNEKPNQSSGFHPTNAPTSNALTLPNSGLSIRDVDDYFADPTTAALLDSAPYPRRQGAKSKPLASTIIPEPIPLGFKTSHHVSALNTLSQSKGLGPPVFEIEGQDDVADFGGLVKVGEMTIVSERRWRSKKEAKEGIAEEAMNTVNGMEAKRKEPSTRPGVKENWIGILQGKQCCGYLLADTDD